MKLQNLKLRLEDIGEKEKELLARHKAERTELREMEREAIEFYLDKNAKFTV